MKEEQIINQVESDLVDEICQKFEALGIDTSEWEYRFGDGNTASEFIQAGIAWHLEKLNSSTEADKPIQNSPVKEDWKEEFIEECTEETFYNAYPETKFKYFSKTPEQIWDWIETNIIK